MRLRFKITKQGNIRFISHLDYMRAIERALRRAKLPADYTKGFNPHIRLSLASALSLGVSSVSEYAEVELSAPIAAKEAKERLNGVLPDGMKVLAADVVEKAPKLTALLTGAAYTARFDDCRDIAALKNAADSYNAEKDFPYDKKPSPAKPSREINLKSYIPRVEFSQDNGKAVLSYFCRITPEGTVKAGDLLTALTTRYFLKADGAEVERTALYGADKQPLIQEGRP